MRFLASVALGHAVKRCENVAWHRFSYRHAVQIRQALVDKFAPATANRHLSAWRAVMREAWRLGLMSREAMERAADVESVRGRREARGVWLTEDQVLAVFRACQADGSLGGSRDSAVLVLGVLCGLRRQEMVDLNLGDLDLAGGSLRVLGKGATVRVLPLGAAKAVLARWLDARGTGPDDAPLLIGVSLRCFGKRLSSRTIYRSVALRARAAGIKAIGPHDLRKTFATTMLARGVDVLLVQKLLGHASVDTTRLYDLRAEIAQREAQGRLTFPGLE